MALNLSTVCECWQAVPWGAVGNAFLIARSVCKHGCSYSCFVYLLHKLVHLFHVPFIWLESVHLRSNATAFAEKPQMSRGWPINYNQVHLPVRWLWNVNTVFFYNLAVKSCEKRWSSYQWVIIEKKKKKKKTALAGLPGSNSLSHWYLKTTYSNQRGPRHCFVTSSHLYCPPSPSIETQAQSWEEV